MDRYILRFQTGVLLDFSGSCRVDVFLALTLGYPIVYTFIYSNEIAREVPVAVVDHSKSAASREFIRNWDATASVDVVARCADMEEAKILEKEEKKKI